MKLKSGVAGFATRRNFLKLSAAATGGAILGFYGFKAVAKVDYGRVAYKYWRKKEKGELSDAEFVVMCGTLAPNPHNTQPWKFSVRGDWIDVFADKQRNIGLGDPRRRMMAMGIGCCLENMKVAAGELGYDLNIEPGEWEGKGPCARLLLTKTMSRPRHPWFEALFTRQTNRSPYELDPVPDAVRAALDGVSDFPGVELLWLQAPEALAQMAELHVQAVDAWLADDARHRDGMKWWRFSRQEWETKRDGLSIFTSAAPFLVVEGMAHFATPELMGGDFGKQGEVSWVKATAPFTPAWGVICADKDDPASWIKAGRLAERIYLEADVQGHCICPMAYTTEIESEKTKLKNLLGLKNQEPLFVFRLGKAAALEKSVRRELKSVLS